MQFEIYYFQFFFPIFIITLLYHLTNFISL